MIYDLHLIMDSSDTFDSMSPELQDQLTSMSAEWPSFPALGTKEINNKKVVHARIQALAMSEPILQGLIDSYSLTWEILGIREGRETKATYDEQGAEITPSFYNEVKTINKSAMLPYLNDMQNGTDDQDNPILQPPTLSDTIYLSMYAGTAPLKLT